MLSPSKVPDTLFPLRRDIRDLGRQLGEVLAERGGDGLLARVESIHTETKAAHKVLEEGGPASLDVVEHSLAGLPLDDAVSVARAFAHFLRLANIAEQHHRVRRRRAYSLDKDKPFQRGSADREFKRWIASGTSIEQLEASLRSLDIELVLTARPTEAARRTTLRLQRSIARRLAERDRPELTRDERAENAAALKRIILTLWESDELRHKKPTPEDEARWGLAVVEQSLWSVVPRFVKNLERALIANGGSPLPGEFAPLTFASWMGGDRDGNPFVTPEVTDLVVSLQTWMGADLFGQEIDRLRASLSVIPASAELRERVGDAREPYRALFRTLRHRLSATQREAERRLGIQQPRGTTRESQEARPFSSGEDLLEPLQLAFRSLESCGLSRLARGPLIDLIRQTTAFGPFLVSLDIRQEAPRHSQALDAIRKPLGLGPYSSLDEESRIRWISEALTSTRPLLPQVDTTDPEAREVIETLATVARLPREAFGAYVISMCQNASDVLAVDLLQKEAGVRSPLRIAPLFETQRDLENAGQVLERLFQVEVYRKRHGDEQEIMLGYSDSAKDSGRLSAAWALYTAQEDVVAKCGEFGVQPTLFHGRGGTVGRGGGPTWLALRSQPPGSMQGRIRVTEQGEVIDTKFGLPAIAARSMELYVTGVLEAELGGGDQPTASWRRRMENIAQRLRDAYRKLVQETPSFLEYFHHATPVDELGSLLIGSRPARRKTGGGFDSLRAIPWVFAWPQARYMIPAWLGVAEGLTGGSSGADGGGDAGNESIEELREMYRNWPFFRSTIGLIEMAVAKADSLVAAHHHTHLVPDELKDVGKELFERLKATKARLLEVTESAELLDSQPIIRRSISVRNPYVDPLHVLQVELLKRLRSASDSTEVAPLIEALKITISGIAAGIRNTG